MHMMQNNDATAANKLEGEVPAEIIAQLESLEYVFHSLCWSLILNFQQSIEDEQAPLRWNQGYKSCKWIEHAGVQHGKIEPFDW